MFVWVGILHWPRYNHGFVEYSELFWPNPNCSIWGFKDVKTFFTKAVVAIFVLSSLVDGVGAVGVPVNSELEAWAGIGYTWFNLIFVVICYHLSNPYAYILKSSIYHSKWISSCN